jgi:flavin reductase (DIM6/NTAB) family NADH-FMN oxidoreductase RutF
MASANGIRHRQTPRLFRIVPNTSVLWFLTSIPINFEIKACHHLIPERFPMCTTRDQSTAIDPSDSSASPKMHLPKMRTITPSVLYFGTPVALISTLNTDGSTNLTPISSVWALGDRVVLGISTGSQGAENLQRAHQCVINLPSPALWKAVERIGRTTGRNPVPDAKRAMGYQHEPDKFSCGRLTPMPSYTVDPLRVAECPLQLDRTVSRP